MRLMLGLIRDRRGSTAGGLTYVDSRVSRSGTYLSQCQMQDEAVCGAVTIHFEISRIALPQMFEDLIEGLDTFLGILVGAPFLRKAQLAFTLEIPFLEHLSSFLVYLQARSVADLELGIGRDISLGSKDHHVANVATAYEWVATVIDIGTACPNTNGP